jgi:DNA polymerase III subunit alpha
LKNEPFSDLLDLCIRVDLRTANKRVLEHLIFAGALDNLPGNRAQKTAELGTVMETAIEKKRALETGQMGLFDISEKTVGISEGYAYQPLAPWSDKEKLEKELEVVGFYLSAHPLDSYKKQLKRLNIEPFAVSHEKAKQINTLKEISIAGYGLVKSKRVINTKKGDRMAFVQLEDYQSQAEIVLFPSIFKKVEAWLDEYDIFIVKGNVDAGSINKCKILANEMVPLELFFQEWKAFTGITLQIPPNKSILDVEKIKELLPKGKAPLFITFQENGKRLKLKTQKTVALDTPLIEQLEQLEIDVYFQC